MRAAAFRGLSRADNFRAGASGEGGSPFSLVRLFRSVGTSAGPCGPLGSAPLTPDIPELFQDTRPRGFELYREHVGPMWAKMLRMIGFDRSWVRGEGSYLWDAEGRRYLNFMSGWRLFNFGRRHSVIRRALAVVMEADLPTDPPPSIRALQGRDQERGRGQVQARAAPKEPPGLRSVALSPRPTPAPASS